MSESPCVNEPTLGGKSAGEQDSGQRPGVDEKKSVRLPQMESATTERAGEATVRVSAEQRIGPHRSPSYRLP